MIKKSIFIIISGLIFMFPVISQALLVLSDEPTLANAVVVTDVYGNPEAIKITGTFYDDCTHVLYDQVSEMDNTLLVQVFVKQDSFFCELNPVPFTHVVPIDSIPENFSITVGLYNASAEDDILQVYGDPMVIQWVEEGDTETENILVDISPATLNLKSKGRFVKASIELPSEYDNENMALESVRLGGEIDAEKIRSKDGIFIAKFDREDVIDYLKSMDIDPPAKVEVSIEFQFSGDTTDLTVEAKDTIKVLH